MLRCVVGLTDITKIILLIVAGGFVGGIASFFLELISNSVHNKRPSCFYLQKGNDGVEGAHGNSTTCVITNDNKKLCWKMYIIHSLIRGFIGAAGAFGGILVLIVASKFPQEKDLFTIANLLFLLSMSVICGYASDRLLPALSNALMKRVQELENKTAEFEKKHEEALKNAKSDNDKLKLKHEVSVACLSGYHALNSKTATNISIAIDTLEKVLPKNELHKIDRSINFLLGALYRNSNEYEKAMEIYSKFIDSVNSYKSNLKSQELPEKEEEFKRNIADAHFNKACIYSLQAEQLKSDSADSEQMKQKAFIELEMAINGNADNKIDANNEPDLNFIKSDDKFKKLVENSKSV
ncbi:MAG: hypothetical protein HQK92_13270 [Nitrospirae bacterium]|nr:hypothetical protein [Nitrospirota bacterium]